MYLVCRFQVGCSFKACGLIPLRDDSCPSPNVVESFFEIRTWRGTPPSPVNISNASLDTFQITAIIAPPPPASSGNWIAASTIVPNVRYTYGKGESPPPGSSSPSSDNLDGRSTCTLEELSMAISGNECVGDYEPSSPVRPLRARISALNNTVKKGEMPTVVALAGFAPGDDEGGVGREEGAVRGRGIWGVKGANHLRWEFDTMNVDLGGDKILKTEASGGKKADAADSSEGAGHWGGRSVYEFFLDQNMLIVAWKGDLPKAEDAVVFVREEVPR